MSSSTQNKISKQSSDAQFSRVKLTTSEPLPLPFGGRLPPPRTAQPRLTQVEERRSTSAAKTTSSRFIPQVGRSSRVPSIPAQTKSIVHQQKLPKETFSGDDTQSPTDADSAVELTATDILRCCQETDFKDVYEISLSSAHLVKIQHLDPFTKLRSLDLSCNSIRTIENLSKNRELRDLKLYDNQIRQISNLDGLKDLLHLHLQYNRIQRIGSGLLGLTKLRVLRLDCNQIAQIDARELSPCIQLTSLDLSNNSLHSIEAICCLANLEELYVRHNKLETVTNLSRCKKLQEVDLSNNPLCDLSGLRESNCLRVLSISHCPLSTFESLGKLNELEELNASYCQLSSVKPLAGLFPSLQILNLSHNILPDANDLSALQPLEDLIELSINGNPFCATIDSTDLIIDTVHCLLPQLQMLNSINLIRSSSRLLMPQVRPDTPQSRAATFASPTEPSPPSVSQRSSNALDRPPSTVFTISGKEMDRQLSDIQAQLNSFEAEFSAKLQNIRASIKHIPESVSSKTRSGSVQSTTWSRPSDKTGSLQSTCGSRPMEIDALAQSKPGSRPPDRSGSLQLTSDSGSRPLGRNVSAHTTHRSRPPSRCGLRSRLQDAKEFADKHFA